MMHMMDGMMNYSMGGMMLGGIIWVIISVGIAVLVWLWVIKLYRELYRKKK